MLAAILGLSAFFVFLLISTALMHLRLHRRAKDLDKVIQYNRRISDEMMDKMDEYVLLMDEEFVIEAVNPSLCRWMNTGEEFLVGRRVRETPLWPTELKDTDVGDKLLRKLVEKGYVDIRYDRNQEQDSVTITQVRLYTVAGTPKRYLGIGHDVTDETRKNENLNRRKNVDRLITDLSALSIGSIRVHESVVAILRETCRFLDAGGAFASRFQEGDAELPAGWVNQSEFREWKTDLKATFSPVIDWLRESMGPTMRLLNTLSDNPDVPTLVQNHAEEKDLSSLVVLPLVNGEGSTTGVILYHFQLENVILDEASLHLLNIVREIISGLLIRHEARQEILLFRHGLDASGQGFALIDSQGDLAYANTAYLELMGLQDQKKEKAWSAYHGSFATKVEKLILPLAREGQRWTGELTVNRPDGGLAHTIESFFPLSSGSSGTTYVADAVTDISSQKALERQLTAAKKTADNANRAKSDFLANMSHEIRTPMNAILGLSYLALRTDLSSKQRDYIEKVSSAARNLLGIINDVLDFSKIEAGHLELEQQPFSLDEVFDRLADLTSLKAKDQGVELRFRRHPNLAKVYEGDALRLGQILLNLTGNALKFTEFGKVTISAAPATDGEDGIAFSVEDEGIGMTEEQLGNLFTAFQQADASTTRKFGGTGLGLVISRRLVQLMDGDLTVESEFGKGSRFSFTVKIERRSEDDQNLRIPEEATNWQVSIVAPEDDVVDDVKIAIESLGWIVERSSSFSTLADSWPSRRVLFVNPAFSGPPPPGFEKRDTVIIAIGEENAAVDWVDGILPLPFSYNRLKTAVFWAFDGDTNPQDTAETRTGVSVVQGRILLAEDNPVNQQVTGELLTQAGLQVDIVEDGKQALEKTKEKRYDVVVLDLQMPVMNGYQAAAKIRQYDDDIPIIALTASTLGSVREKIYRSGFSDFLPKPVEPDELYRVLGRYLAVSLSPVAPPPEETKPVMESLGIPGIDEAAGLALVLGNEGTYRKVLRNFAANFRPFCDTVRQTMETKNLEEAIQLFHSLRGASGNIGANDVHQTVGSFEESLRKEIWPEEERLKSFLTEFDDLLDHIEFAVGERKEKDGMVLDRRELQERLEDLIRRSETSASELLDHIRIPGETPVDRRRTEDIRSALSRWDFDAALDFLEDWRSEISTS